jgi:hypothetical protein
LRAPLKKEAATAAGSHAGGFLMLPELGHFALILALLLAALQAFFGIAGRASAARSLARGRAPAVAGQFVMVATAIACLVYGVRLARLLGTLRRRELELRAAAFLSRHRAYGARMRARCCCGFFC